MEWKVDRRGIIPARVFRSPETKGQELPAVAEKNFSPKKSLRLLTRVGRTNFSGEISVFVAGL